MTLLHRLASVLRWIARRSQAEQELDDELQSYLEMSTGEKIRDGHSPAAARRAAIIELGGVEAARERVRAHRHGGMLDEAGRDVRLALRLFAREPGFTAVVVLTLALGIGANVAIFSLIEALLLRPLPVRDPHELVQIGLRMPGSQGEPGTGFSYPIARALADQRNVFSGVAGFSAFTYVTGPPEAVVRVPGALVTGGYYATLGLAPVAGRLLTPADDEPGATLVAVISHGYWQRQLAGSSGAVGRTIQVNGQPVTIVGISGAGFDGAYVGSAADITMTVATLPRVAPTAAPLLGPGNFWLRLLARPAVSAGEAQSRLNVLWPQIADSVIARHWPVSRRQAMADSRFVLENGSTGWTPLRAQYRRPLLALMTGVGVVLLIACANIAGLLLARASTRRREIAVRLAIGASRGRLIRQFLIESLMLALMGAGAAIGLAWISGNLLVGLISAGPSPLAFDLSPNWTVAGFTMAVTIGTAMLFGVVPALQTTVATPGSTLREDTRTASGKSRLLPWLVSAQVALSLVLLAGAGLFVRTLQNLHRVDPGFDSRGVLLVNLEDRPGPVPPDLVDIARGVPGVVSATVSSHTPLSGSVWSDPAVPAGQHLPERDNAYFVAAGPGFFSTMQTPLLAGREVTSHDTAQSPAVALINEEYARRHFPNRNPVGHRLTASVNGQRRQLEIIGLARNTSAAGLRAAPPPTVYVAHAQLTGTVPTTLTVRATGSLAQVSAALQQTLQAKMPGGPIDVRPLSAQVQATLTGERMMATLASAFAVLALTLACVGLYGVLAYAVAQRTREIGIRMALGARRSAVIALIVGGGARLVAIGIALGLPAAWFASRSVESMLFGLQASDPMTIGGVIGLLTLAAQLTACIPARRAARVDPIVALRQD